MHLHFWDQREREKEKKTHITKKKGQGTYLLLDFIRDADLGVWHLIQCKVHLVIHGPEPPQHSLALQRLKVVVAFRMQSSCFDERLGTVHED
jgi:hypothetical protein